MRNLVAIAAFLLLMLATVRVWSADCYPSLTNPPEHVIKLSQTASNGDTHVAVWRSCADNTKIYIDTGKWADVADFVKKAVAGTFSTDEANTARLSLPKMPDAEFQKIRRMVLVDYYGFPPMTLDGIAYKRTVIINGAPKYVRWGKLPIGTPCTNPDNVKAGGYMQIDRTKVTKDSPNTSLPDTAWSLCG